MTGTVLSIIRQVSFGGVEVAATAQIHHGRKLVRPLLGGDG